MLPILPSTVRVELDSPISLKKRKLKEFQQDILTEQSTQIIAVLQEYTNKKRLLNYEARLKTKQEN